MSENTSNRDEQSAIVTPRQIPFVVVSGLPGSGKTTLARNLAPALRLPLIDKDDILEDLFEAFGVGDVDRRQLLSRVSDGLFEQRARSSKGAVLTSFWRNPETSPQSGTPTDWIASVSQRIVEVHCICDPEIAAMRYVNRIRHPGHLDSVKRPEDVLSNFRRLASVGALGLGKLLQVDTANEIDMDSVVRDVKTLLGDA